MQNIYKTQILNTYKIQIPTSHNSGATKESKPRVFRPLAHYIFYQKLPIHIFISYVSNSNIDLVGSGILYSKYNSGLLIFFLSPPINKFRL